jgi:NSS family neurotransmitter:Na+ symporter
MKMAATSLVYGQLGGWRSRTTLVLALSASAVGLGNIWRFAYLLGEHGGGPFMLAYVVCLFGVAAPLLIAEVLIGHHGRGNPFAALRSAADRSLRSRAWAWVGGLACATGFLILGYYLVVAGWTLAYAHKMQAGVFSDASAVMVAEHFQSFLTEPAELLYWQSLFLLLATALSLGGVRRGLGLAFWIAVPALMVLLGLLVSFSLEYGDLLAAPEFLFDINTMDFTAASWLVAAGQAFYTLGIGVGVGIAFGAYAPARMPVGRAVVAVAIFDVAVALAAGLAIFPIVFANNLLPAQGPGLAFISLPYAFGNMMLGELVGSLFFLLLAVASLGSVLAMMEPIVALLRQHLKVPRLVAVALLSAVLWLLALAVSRSLAGQSWLGLDDLFAQLSNVTAQWLLPLVGLLTLVFVAWRMRPELLRVELVRESGLFFSLWLALLRYIAAPALMLLLLVNLL